MALGNKINQGSKTVTSGSVDNATATATTPTPVSGSGQKVYITGISASFDAAVANKLLQIKDGATVIWSIVVTNSFTIDFDSPLECTPSQAAAAVLAASGTGGNHGFANLKYYIK